MKKKRLRYPVTLLLLVLITGTFAYEWRVGALSDGGAGLIRLGAVLPGTLYFGHYWRLLAATFLHAHPLHWAVNAWALFQLGSLFETIFSPGRLLIVYLVCGVAASSASSLFNDAPSVGASGAIFGILGALLVSMRRSPHRGEKWARSMEVQLVFWTVINIGLGFAVENIDNVAHLTGLGTGMLMGFLPQKQQPARPSRAVIDVQPYEG